jgi:tetratricopeptide (TPR) repeat protein
LGRQPYKSKVELELEMANIIRWGITDGMRLAKTLRGELNDPSNYTTEEFLAAGERALKKYPNEWVIHFVLADKYQEMGYYAEGLREAQRCVEIRPNDIRSVYTLATSYNLLTRAAWSDEENQAAKIFSVLVRDIDKVDKRVSQAGLDRTGLAIETCAVQAIRWFERALSLNPDQESKKQISQDLYTLYRRFPQFQR